jgi:hypothetical protein
MPAAMPHRFSQAMTIALLVALAASLALMAWIVRRLEASS